MKKQKQKKQRVIVINNKARHNFQFEAPFEAGLALEGWEVKSLRAHRIQLGDSYVFIKNREAWLIGANIAPLSSVSTHLSPNCQRIRKLLLHRKEISKLNNYAKKKGYSVIAVNLHWRHNRIKAAIAVAKGKKSYDKRETLKQRDWYREKQRTLKNTRVL